MRFGVGLLGCRQLLITPMTLIEHWNGISWSIVTSPNNGTSGLQLNGVTCASASDCWAVGMPRYNW